MRTFLTTILVFALAVAAGAEERIRILTTLPDLREIAREVGAGRVEASSLLSGPEDPHFIDAKPSFIRLAHDADLFVVVGLELEIGYEPLIRENSRNPKIQRGQPGYLDLSGGIQRLGIPNGPVDRSMGDVHPGGNPHYWTDPGNWKVIGRQIADRLKQLDPAGAAEYEKALADFSRKVDEHIANWSKELAGLRGTGVVTYHDDFPYFLHRFGLRLVGTLEPKPGVAPTASHLAQVIGAMRSEKAELVIHSVFQPTKVPDLVAGKVNGRVVLVAHMVGSLPDARDLWSTVDHNVKALVESRQ